jgi:Transposase DDE domain
MCHAKIPVAYQAPLYARNNFLAPFQAPEVQSLITATGVDTPRVKRYTVERVLRLYLFAAMLQGFFLSLRGIVRLQENLTCRLFVGLSTWSLQGLSDANTRLSFVVFQPVYQYLSLSIRSALSFSQVANQFGAFKIFDCTHFQLALRLMPWGKPQNQRAHKGQLKCAVRLDEVAWVPEVVNLDASVHNDNCHFEHLIDWTKRGFTYLFDRGFRKIEILVKLHLNHNFFITRLHQGTRVTVVKELLYEPLPHGLLTILHDQCIRLGSGKQQTPPFFRLITARSIQGNSCTTLYFLTNRFDLDPWDVAAIYRYRWQIECFFKWLKSSLKITHFLSYSENGVYLQIYVTLIFHLLLVHYHHAQGLPGQLGINTQRHAFNAFCNTMLTVGIRIGLLVALLHLVSFVLTVSSPGNPQELVTYDLFTT